VAVSALAAFDHPAGFNASYGESLAVDDSLKSLAGARTMSAMKRLLPTSECSFAVCSIVPYPEGPFYKASSYSARDEDLRQICPMVIGHIWGSIVVCLTETL
jgi:hypothetical protein